MPPIHLEIINDKIWIKNDDTERGVATDLLEAGVPKEQIVLGFQFWRCRVTFFGFAKKSNPTYMAFPNGIGNE